MADGTKIEWADATLNYANGCSLASPGCTNCYAMKLAGTRLRHHPSRAGLTQDSKAGSVWTGEVRMHEPALQQALSWKRGRRIFWNAHGDLFHENVSDEAIDRLLAVCALTPQHTHMILTKRSRRMREYMTGKGLDPLFDGRLTRIRDAAYRLAATASGAWDEAAGMVARQACVDALHRTGEHTNGGFKNVWLGVSVEDQQRADERIPDLLATPAAVRFVSAEPLLGPVSLKIEIDHHQVVTDALTGQWIDYASRNPNGFDEGPGPKLNWVIVGGESGQNARPMHADWARSLRDQCQAAGVPFLFKQWGEWAPICEMSEASIDACYHPAPERDPEARRRLKVGQCVLHGDGRRFDGNAMFERPAFEQGSRAMTMMRIGKKAAARMIDGREWSEFPG